MPTYAGVGRPRVGSTRTPAPDHTEPLGSHYSAGEASDSDVERTLTDKWELVREADVLDLGEEVMLPAFAAEHPDGRRALFAIVGFWTPESLGVILAKPRPADVDNLVVAVSGRVDCAADDFGTMDGRVLWFKAGFHVLVEGGLPDGRNRTGDIELYDSARFFTVTGDYVPETPDYVAQRQDALSAIHREYVHVDSDIDSSSAGAAQSMRTVEQTPSTAGGSYGNDLDDETLLQKARDASNGQKFTALWNGNTAGYESHSEADMALCCLLAFWTGGDPTQMDRLFRASELLRPKWDEVHYADGATYGERTIERAITTTSERYDPSSRDGSDQDQHGDRDGADRGQTGGDQDRVAYLEEKTRVLTEQVADLEATLTDREAQIADLEAERAALQEALADCQTEDESSMSHDTPAEDGVDESWAVWATLKRTVRRD